MALVEHAGRLVGVKELLRAGGVHPGEQTQLKRLLRELVKEGRLEQDGKRFGVAGREYARKSGPAWDSRKPAAVRAKAGAVEGFRKQKPGAEPRRRDREVPTPFGLGRSKAKAPPPVERTFEKPRHEHVPAGPKQVLMEGIINHHPDGFAFVRALTGKSEDVFIPPDQAKKALDHDRVVVEVIPQRGGRTLGRIVEVKRRTRQHVVGTYWEQKGKAWVEPREAELGLIEVPKTQLARPGDVVKVRLGVGGKVVGTASGLVGEVSGSLGSEADHSVEVLSVAYSRGFHDEFPEDVMVEADAFALELTEHDLHGRRDLRDLPLITIDGEDARDFDDAIYVEARDHGWRLIVAIADVSHYVTPGSALDAEGLHRATSVYLPGRVLPMLPERLSNGLCSLKPDEDRLCMVADMVIDHGGVTTETELYAAVMRSKARCTYTEVHQVLNGGSVPHREFLKPMLQEAHRLTKALNRMRVQRGAVDFDLPETRPELDDKGLPVRLVRRERWESHRLVEECMLAANEAVAREFREADRATVNRFHGEPDEDRLSAFLTLLGAYGIKVPTGKVGSKQLNQLLKDLDGHPEQKALHQLALRSMMQAVYSSETSGHYGLGATDYLHFTSPIRRYPDLLVHRLLKHWWKKHELSERELEELESMAQHSSERERAAMLVEREVNALYACLLMKDRVGESFAATVSSLAEHGFFVELDDLYVEGLVKGETVYPDFEFDQATYRITYSDGRVVKVGLKCTVTLLSVNLTKKQMDFVVEGFTDEEEALTPYEAKKPRARGGRGPRVDERDTRRGRDAAVKPAGRPGGREERPKPWEHGKREERPKPWEHGKREQPHEERAKPWEALRKRDEPQQHREPERRPPPPSSQEDGAPKSFDPRAVLDRLWRERGGKQAPAASSPRAPGRRDDRDDRGGRSGGRSGGGGGRSGGGGRNDRGGRRR